MTVGILWLSALRTALVALLSEWPPYLDAKTTVWLSVFRERGNDLLTGYIAFSACRAYSSFRLFLSISRRLCFLVTIDWTTPHFSSLSSRASFRRAFCSLYSRSRCSFLWIFSVWSSSQCVTRVFFWYLWCFDGFEIVAYWWGAFLIGLSWVIDYFGFSWIEDDIGPPKPPGVVKSIEMVEPSRISKKFLVNSSFCMFSLMLDG